MCFCECCVRFASVVFVWMCVDVSIVLSRVLFAVVVLSCFCGCVMGFVVVLWFGDCWCVATNQCVVLGHDHPRGAKELFFSEYDAGNLWSIFPHSLRLPITQIHPQLKQPLIRPSVLSMPLHLIVNGSP